MLVKGIEIEIEHKPIKNLHLAVYPPNGRVHVSAPNEYTDEQIKNTLNIIESTIKNCEKIQPKFKEGTPQLSLSRNRIKALNVSKDLINKLSKTNLENTLEFTKFNNYIRKHIY